MHRRGVLQPIPGDSYAFCLYGTFYGNVNARRG
jgi:hypothetical protein